jgi:hypothetical protein
MLGAGVSSQSMRGTAKIPCRRVASQRMGGTMPSKPIKSYYRFLAAWTQEGWQVVVGQSSVPFMGVSLPDRPLAAWHIPSVTSQDATSLAGFEKGNRTGLGCPHSGDHCLILLDVLGITILKACSPKGNTCGYILGELGQGGAEGGPHDNLGFSIPGQCQDAPSPPFSSDDHGSPQDRRCERNSTSTAMVGVALPPVYHLGSHRLQNH